MDSSLQHCIPPTEEKHETCRMKRPQEEGGKHPGLTHYVWSIYKQEKRDGGQADDAITVKQLRRRWPERDNLLLLTVKVFLRRWGQRLLQRSTPLLELGQGCNYREPSHSCTDARYHTNPRTTPIASRGGGISLYYDWHRWYP